jgi:hypothetical protein
MSTVQAARLRRTDWFFADRVGFMTQLARELKNLERRAARKGFKPVARLNGTSDIPWESMLLGGRTIFERFPGITFYDYTKSPRRALNAQNAADWPENYSLTLSRTEGWLPATADEMADRGVNVAVVFDTPKGQPLPETFEGVPVIDGRVDDWRFRDPRGVVVGLSALGKARKDTTGFVVRTED